MGQTLTNGIFLPNEGERNCYTGLEGNWRAIDGYIGGYNVHIADAVIHVTQEDRNKWDAVTSKADASALTAHTGDTTIHVTAADKAKWDAVTGKADDTNVMHLTGDETSTGKKVFGDMAAFKGSYLGNEASANARTGIVLESNRDTHGQSGIYITKFRQNKAQGSMSGNDVVYIAFDVLENSVRTNQALRASFTQFVNDIPTRVIFYSDVNGERYLGTATNKWTHINGLNPGALSLPDLSAAVDISSYITNFNKSVNTFTPPADGWIFIRVRKTTLDHVSIRMQQQNGLISSTETADFTTWGCHLPVVSSKAVEIYIYADGIASAYFYPCQGNV